MSNNDEFESDFEGFDDKKGGTTLADIWNSSPLLKVGVVVAGLGILVAGSTFLGGGGGGSDVISAVPSAPQIKGDFSSEELDPATQIAVEAFNEQQVAQAEQSGDSVIGILTQGRQSLDINEGEGEGGGDDLDALRQVFIGIASPDEIQEPAVASPVAPSAPDDTPSFTTPTGNQPQSLQALQQQAQPLQAQPEAIASLSQAMAQQMQQILSQQQIAPVSTVQITPPDFLAQNTQGGGQGVQGVQGQDFTGAQSGQGGEAPLPPAILQQAGEIVFGQTLLEANTDAPGPVLAQILSGPLSGGRLLGAFQTTNEFIVIGFNTLVFEDVSYQIQAVAINPQRNFPGLRSEINRRYFTRVILPAAAAFLEGFGEAVAESGTTNVTVEGDTVIEEEEDLDTREELLSASEEAFEELGDILDDVADDTQVLIRVYAGTPIGVLFLQPVVEQTGFN